MVHLRVMFLLETYYRQSPNSIFKERLRLLGGRLVRAGFIFTFYNKALPKCLFFPHPFLPPQRQVLEVRGTLVMRTNRQILDTSVAVMILLAGQQNFRDCSGQRTSNFSAKTHHKKDIWKCDQNTSASVRKRERAQIQESELGAVMSQHFMRDSLHTTWSCPSQVCFLLLRSL